jgi:hypothetical protein
MPHVIATEELPHSGSAHRFVGSDKGYARHIDIHTRGRMTTEWLKEDRSGSRDLVAGERRGSAGGAV